MAERSHFPTGDFDPKRSFDRRFNVIFNAANRIAAGYPVADAFIRGEFRSSANMMTGATPINLRNIFEKALGLE